LQGFLQAPHDYCAPAPDIAHIVGMAVRETENHRFHQILFYRLRYFGLREDIRGGFREMACLRM